MTSYLRNIFGSQNDHSQRPSHARSPSAPSNYIYAEPPTTGAPKPKRSNSYSAHATSPSPLRYPIFDTSSHASSDLRRGAPSKPPLYRSASYKSSEHVTAYGPPTPTVSFGPSSRTSSNSSLYPGMTPAGNAHKHHVRLEARPPLRRNQPWNGSADSSAASTHSHNGSTDLGHTPNTAPRSLLHGTKMHPLLTRTRLHSAPIAYDIIYTPSARTVLDRSTQAAIPASTLAQPATIPALPIPSSSSATAPRLVLRADALPWPVVVVPLASGGKTRSAHVTVLDLLYALHTTLLARVTPAEWESLGHGSRAQRRVAGAYEKRCERMGGGWEHGVRRVDWLHGRTRFAGVEMDKGEGASATGVGKLIFRKP